MKKIFSCLLSAVMVLTMMVLPAYAESTYTPGTYEASAAGLNGDIVLNVTFSENAITDITVVSSSETAGIADGAFEQIPAAIIEHQSLAVDAVSGCTYSANGILNAVAAAVEMAGGDVEGLKNVAVNKGEGETITMDAECVVVGGGYAGLASAITAAEKGVNVILIEKQAALGGSSAMSGGGVKAALASDGDDYIEVALDFWRNEQTQTGLTDDYTNYEWVEAFLRESEDNLNWLADLGYQYYVVPYGGSELAFPNFGDNQEEVGGGSVVCTMLEEQAAVKGVTIIKNCKGTEVMLDNGSVIGLKAESTSNNDVYVFNTTNVVLATGGYGMNKELINRFLGGLGVQNFSGTAAGATGDGILMAEAAGADIFEEGWFIGTRGTAILQYNLGYPLNAFTWNPYLYVTADGVRFVNENAHYSAIDTWATLNKLDYYYIILDGAELSEENIATLEDGLVQHADFTFKGNTVEELATNAGINVENFANTVAIYNGYQAAGEDAEFGKEAEYCTPIENAPFYAIKVTPTHLGTMGGVKTTLNMEALDKQGNIIPGLYAAGECANRNFYSKIYTTGTGLGVAVFTGRHAGAAIAERLGK